MEKSPEYIDIFLEPGGFHFGTKNTRIRTILGSCIAITMWHPTEKIGGMCHYLMPSRQSQNNAGRLDGRYADEAIVLFMREIRMTRTSPREYETKIFGGGSQFRTGEASAIDMPRKNIEACEKIAKDYNLFVKSHHIGGQGNRYLIFDLWTGYVWMRYSDIVMDNP